MLFGILIIITLLVHVISFSSYQIIQEGKPLNSVHFSPDGSLFAVGSQDKIQNIYSFSTLQSIYSFDAGGPVRTVRFSPNQKYLVYALTSTKVILMDTNYTIILNMTSAFSTISEMDFNNDSTRIVVCGKAGSGVNGY